jgi:hypothetical protein
VQSWSPLIARPNAGLPPRCLSPCTSTGTRSAGKLFRDTGNSRASFLTADNPFSVASSERANRFKRALLRFVPPESRLPTVAHDPAGRWPDEQGFLVLGWSMRAVKALGVTFNQNAVLWMGKDAVPKLVLL